MWPLQKTTFVWLIAFLISFVINWCNRCVNLISWRFLACSHSSYFRRLIIWHSFHSHMFCSWLIWDAIKVWLVNDLWDTCVSIFYFRSWSYKFQLGLSQSLFLSKIFWNSNSSLLFGRIFIRTCFNDFCHFPKVSWFPQKSRSSINACLMFSRIRG